MQTAFDPWTQVKTIHGLAADEVISALQKEVRRGNADNACRLAYEMIKTSPELERKLWDRLCVISVEDIGFGNVNAPVLVHTLWQMSLRYNYGEGDRGLFPIQAVRILCASPKDRSTDEMINTFSRTDAQPSIPDYALDMHTARGQAMGRDFKHFLSEGARINPELPDRDTSYLKKLLQTLDT